MLHSIDTVALVVIAACSLSTMGFVGDGPDGRDSTGIHTAPVHTKKPMDVVFMFEGQWRRNTKRAPIFETWVRESGKSMVGNVYSMTKGIEGELKERMKIVERDSGLYYQAQVLDQNMGATIEFKMVSYTDTSITFENRKHDFPQTITYMKLEKDAFDAVLTGVVDGREFENIYHFARTVQ